MAKPEPYRATAANIIYQNDATASFTRADWIGHVKFDNECDAVIADLFGELEI